jgi:hypothetical protein
VSVTCAKQKAATHWSVTADCLNTAALLWQARL